MGNCTTAENTDPPPRSGVGAIGASSPPPPPPPQLPAGWERKRHESGRFYFVDHNTKTTVWDLPQHVLDWQRAQVAASQGRGPGANAKPPASLPPGWAMNRTPDGRVYYVDHNTKTTQWHPPIPAFVYSLMNTGQQWVRGFDASGGDEGQRWIIADTLSVSLVSVISPSVGLVFCLKSPFSRVSVLRLTTIKPHPPTRSPRDIDVCVCPLQFPSQPVNQRTEAGQIELCVLSSLPMGVDWQRRVDQARKIWYIRGDDLDSVQKWAGKTVADINHREFKEKCAWFRQQMERLRLPWNENHSDLKLRRDHFTFDSFNIVEKLDQRGMRSNFRFEIANETKLSDDAGGVTREWFEIMTKEVYFFQSRRPKPLILTQTLIGGVRYRKRFVQIWRRW